MRTTIDIDAVILREAKQRAAEEGKSLGQLVGELLAPALKRTENDVSAEFVWHAARLQPRINLEDKEAVWKALDQR